MLRHGWHCNGALAAAADVDGAERTRVIGTPQAITEDSSAIDKEFYDYYRTLRGPHPRASTAFWRTSDVRTMLSGSLQALIGFRHGRSCSIAQYLACSRLSIEQANELASDPKELFVVPGAGHVDLHDRIGPIPFDKLNSFFREHLKVRIGSHRQ